LHFAYSRTAAVLAFNSLNCLSTNKALHTAAPLLYGTAEPLHTAAVQRYRSGFFKKKEYVLILFV